MTTGMVGNTFFHVPFLGHGCNFSLHNPDISEHILFNAISIRSRYNSKTTDDSAHTVRHQLARGLFVGVLAFIPREDAE